MKPNTPASCSDARSGTLPGTAPPQKPTSTKTWPSADRRLISRAATVVVGGMRVQRHVEDRGDAAGRGRPGRGGEPLPLGAARLVDVHVGVDQAGQQHLVVRERRPSGSPPVRSSYAATAVIRSPAIPTAAATSAPFTIARRARTTRSRSAATVGGVSVGAEQHGHVVVLVGVVDGEHDHDLGVEAVDVGAGVEAEHVGAALQRLGTDRADPAVGIGDALAEELPVGGSRAVRRSRAPDDRQRCRERAWRACSPSRLQAEQRDLAQVVDGLGALGLVVVLQPPLELAQDLLGVAAGGPDQEDPVEPLLVRRVARLEPRCGVPGGRVDTCLLPLRLRTRRARRSAGWPDSACSSSSSVSSRAAASAAAMSASRSSYG